MQTPKTSHGGSLTFQAPSPHCVANQNACLRFHETETRTQATWQKWARISTSTRRYSARRMGGVVPHAQSKKHAKVPTQFAAPLRHLRLMMSLIQPRQSMSRQRHRPEVSPLTEASITGPPASDQNQILECPGGARWVGDIHNRAWAAGVTGAIDRPTAAARQTKSNCELPTRTKPYSRPIDGTRIPRRHCRCCPTISDAHRTNRPDPKPGDPPRAVANRAT